MDALIQVREMVEYALVAQRLDRNLLVRGRVRLRLECECVRCLKPFCLPLDLRDFAVDLPLAGEDSSVTGDFVDLTSWVREDILLAFPQHPLCDAGCVGLKKLSPPGKAAQPGQESQMTESVWAVLNELKL